MNGRVSLNGLNGPLEGTAFVFDEPMLCVIGRETDCSLVIPLDAAAEVSRHHCVLTLCPPDAAIQDLGSRNGTFVNGVNIGRRESTQSVEQAREMNFESFPLRDGDVIGIGNNAFAVQIQSLKQAGKEEALPEPKEPDLFAELEESSGQTENFVSSKRHSETVRLVEQMLKTARLAVPGKDVAGIEGYQVINRIGHGGMGDVYMAIREGDKCPMALKMMRPGIAVSEASRRDFLREMEYMKALKHPHILGIYEGGYSKGVFFMALEYCDSGTLDTLIHQLKGQPLPTAGALRLIMQILDALDYAHNAVLPDLKLPDGSLRPTRGLVHRDIKPKNIFLQGYGEQRLAKLADFGLAKSFCHAGLGGCTQTGFFSGTAAYISRQQFLNYKYVGPEVDVWAAAATLYFMLSAHSPRNFKGMNPFCAILETSPVSIFERRPDIPRKLGKLLDAALDDSRQLKFRRAADFKQALMETGLC
ncbi:MAG: hypothetical protein A2X49_10915 [Lentisphaerae bacterium GWF2_52_8]|nr:MAG: hypothetical protein A2X49_10915 [Lentisphaerae bacterium GWF2_52_8]